MKQIVLIIMVAGLAGCGADGEPMRPNASVGVSVGSNGTNTNATVGASNGTFSVGIGL